MFNNIKKLLDWLDGKHNHPEVIFAQFNELRTKVPLLYFVLLSNVFALAYTHYEVAPTSLTIYFPAIVVFLCLLRVKIWLNFGSNNFSLAEARHQIRVILVVAVFMGLIFAAWSFAMYHYGNDLQKSHVAYFMSITVIGIIVCLIHLPAVAILVMATVGMSFVIFFVSSGNPVFIAIALNFLMVMVVLTLIMLGYYRSFSEVIYAKLDLEKEHAKTRRLNKQNTLLANQDSLTELPNRRSFSNHLSELIAVRAKKDFTGDNGFVVGLIDLDGFKPVNDIHGHAAGDRVLADVSIRLTEMLDDSCCLLARIGGDEFAIIVEKPLSAKEINILGKNITKTIQQPISMRSGQVQISGSCGFAIYPEAGTTPNSLMDRADFALYHAKEHARGSSIIFSSEHEDLIKQRSQVELALRQALTHDELYLYFQPIVDGQSGEIVGLEALARWNQEQLGQVPPEQFIPIAEKSGMIGEITQVLFAKAVKELADWPEHIYLSFNLSAHDLVSKAVIKKLIKIVGVRGVALSRVQFEITESVMMVDLEKCIEMTEWMREEGFKIALDDFGTGYSSLGYIHKLSFDKLKIDRSFIHNLTVDQRSQGVVKTILELCNNFSVTCIAEGVETAEQQALLLELGCIQMQGFYFYRPAELKELKLN